MVRAAVIILAAAAVIGTVGIVGALRESGSDETGHRVAVTPNGFVPATITIPSGETVTWVNESGDDTWPASDVHPTHERYPGFDARRAVRSEESWSFTFERAGRWTYHDHLLPETKGVVVVR